MLVFVDESGDAGMKLERAASPFFVVTAVLFEDSDEATACDQKIDHIRKELGLPERTEFHFNKSRRPVREHFLQQVAPYDSFYPTPLILCRQPLIGSRPRPACPVGTRVSRRKAAIGRHEPAGITAGRLEKHSEQAEQACSSS